MLPSPAELNYFLEIANSLNLSRAADRLGVSQPSLSLAMKRLEFAVGTNLFIRHKHGVTLTQAGKQLLLHVRQLLQFWEHTKSEALASNEEIQGYFTLGCHPSMVMQIVSEFLPALLSKYPKLEIHLKHNISRKVYEEVITLKTDIGIVVNPLNHSELTIHKLCDDEVTFWACEGQQSIQHMQSGEAILLCDPELTQTQSLLKQCKKNHIDFARIITVNSLETIAHLTAKKGGIGILPGRVAETMYPTHLQRVQKAPTYYDEICLISRNEHHDVQAIQEIIRAIQAIFIK